jgi:glycosyltransferase involved in cell wall biosynthesis
VSSAPLVSVIVATRDRTDLLADCLDSLLAQTYPADRTQLVVVDNAPSDERTALLVETRYSGRVRYVREDVPGLAVAHNRGVLAAGGSILAFTDDDVRADPQWLAALVAGFTEDPLVGCVTGMILPVEVRTPAQHLLHRHGGFAKGDAVRVFDPASPPADDPLFPFTAGKFGSGANMAFRADVLASLGGFDPATGVGTPARGGDDLLAFFRTVVRGHRLVYRPDAVVHHHLRETDEAVARQVHGYGVGLGAFLAAAVAREPRALPALLKRVPGGLRYALELTRGGKADGAADPAQDGGGAKPWPATLVRLERRGMLAGPFAYVRSRWTVGRALRGR